MTTLIRLSLAGLLLFGSSWCWSQTSMSQLKQATENVYPDSLFAFDAEASDTIVTASTALMDKQRQVYEALFEHKIQGYKHRLAAFRWQLFSSKIIFFAVLLLLLAGIIFSGIQFRKGLQSNELGTTSVEAMPGRIKVSSPVLGVIILIISLLFFYLYLVYIHPIHELPDKFLQ